MAEETKKTSKNVLGRRKEAVARVRLATGKGEIVINGRPAKEYFPGLISEKAYLKPFEVAKLDKYSVSIKVIGGGTASQLGAVVHGLSAAIAKLDNEKRVLLKKEGMLTRDARVKERRKYGLAQKARAKKQSPKR